jgi:hypothetical protein
MPERLTPEKIMPEMVAEGKVGKIFALQEQRTWRKKCFRQGTGRQEPRYRKDTMRQIQQLKELRPTGILWETG